MRAAVGEEDGGEAAEGDAIHATEVGVLLPDFVGVEAVCAEEGAGDDEEQQHGHEEAHAAEGAGDEGEEEIEHLFDRERPENVPVAGEIAAGGLKNVDVEGKGCDQGAAEADLLRDDVTGNVRPRCMVLRRRSTSNINGAMRAKRRR